MKRLIYLTLSIVLTSISAYSFNAPEQLSENTINETEAVVSAAPIEFNANPLINVVNIELELSSSITGAYSLVDISGREVQNGQRSLIEGANDFQIDVSDLDLGMYIVMIELEDEVITKRFSIYK
ncbi:MAG: T9SS type A sorting domain-containing protein [Bacteroidia bacterium]|nr:T9SS type A sorting domain-containing protein [Bacteroidia bacterium]